MSNLLQKLQQGRRLPPHMSPNAMTKAAVQYVLAARKTSLNESHHEHH